MIDTRAKTPATIFDLISFLKNGKIHKKWKGYKIAFLGIIPACNVIPESRDIVYIFYDKKLKQWVLQCNVYPNNCPDESIFLMHFLNSLVLKKIIDKKPQKNPHIHLGSEGLFFLPIKTTIHTIHQHMPVHVCFRFHPLLHTPLSWQNQCLLLYHIIFQM